MIQKLSVRDSVSEDAYSLAPRLREADLREIKASVTKDPEQSLLNGLQLSKECKTVLDDSNNVIAMFGIIQCPEDSSIGLVWFLSSSDIEDHAIQFIKDSHTWINRFHATYPALWLISYSENILHHRWLDHVGFRQHRTISLQGRRFYEFIKVKDTA